VRGPLRPALLLAAACARAARPAPPVATDHVDLPRSYMFRPENIVVASGTRVTWTNHDQFTHAVRFRGAIDTVMIMRPGDSVSYTFTKPGPLPYDCVFHAQAMHGSVLVQ
jgi:plastocyanin